MPSNPNDDVFYDLSNLGDYLRLGPNSRDVKPNVVNRYLRPRVGNLAAVDSLAPTSGPNMAWRLMPAAYDPKLPTLILFQSTISYRRPISLAGVHDILKAIPANA